MTPRYFKLCIFFFLLAITVPTLLWMRDCNFHITGRLDSSTLGSYATFINLVVSITALLVNFILLNVAIRAFKNFDVKKQFHNKQLNLVADLAAEILGTNLKLAYHQKPSTENGELKEIKTGYQINYYSLGDFLATRKVEKIFVSDSIEDILPFLRYRYNPLLPKKIAQALNKLANPLPNRSMVLDGSIDGTFNPSFEDYFGKRPDNYISLYKEKQDISVHDGWLTGYYDLSQNLISDANNVRGSILAWFQIYGADDINI